MIEVVGVASQRLLSLGPQSIGCLSRIVKKSSAFGFRFVCRLAQECSAPLVELFVLMLELIALLLRFGLFCVSVCQFRSDPLLPRVNGVEDRLVKIGVSNPPG